AAALGDRLARFQFQIGRAVARLAAGAEIDADAIDDARYELGSLHDVLLRPLAARLKGAQRLLFLPLGPLHALPCAALWDGAAHLIESRDVVHCPAAGLLCRRGAAASGAAGSLVVGAADDATPRIEHEVDLVASLLGDADILRGADATVARTTA